MNKLMAKIWLLLSGLATCFALQDIILSGNWHSVLHLITVPDGRLLVLIGAAIAAIYFALLRDFRP